MSAAFYALSDALASALMSSPQMGLLVFALCLGTAGCVMQTLGSLRVAIREESDSQKAIAYEIGMDPAQLTRKLQNQEPLKFEEFARLPENVQRAFHLAELIRLGMPTRVQKLVAVFRAVYGEQQRSA
jgi:hypothetical protein